MIEHAGIPRRWKGCPAALRSLREVEFDADTLGDTRAAGDELVRRDRERVAEEIRRIRRKLGLSQLRRRR